jgi:hypothetical protein
MPQIYINVEKDSATITLNTTEICAVMAGLATLEDLTRVEGNEDSVPMRIIKDVLIAFRVEMMTITASQSL